MGTGTATAVGSSHHVAHMASGTAHSCQTSTQAAFLVLVLHATASTINENILRADQFGEGLGQEGGSHKEAGRSRSPVRYPEPEYMI